MIDESNYNHLRLNKTHGALKAYFTPDFPLIETVSQYYDLELLRPGGFNYTAERAIASRFVAKDCSDRSEPLHVTSTFSLRRKLMHYYNIRIVKFATWVPTRLTGSVKFYDKMTAFMCPHFQFNAETATEIERHRLEHNISSEYYNGKTATSVAFHVRRGDKIRSKLWHSGGPQNLKDVFWYLLHCIKPRGESRFFAADAYVKKFLQVVPQKTVVQYCFVASDDYQVIGEMRQALQKHNVPCVVHSITTPTQKGHNRPGSTFEGNSHVHFLSELSVMMEATYFVGTFNSNVGLFVATMRGCHATDRTHFSHSYAVDRDAYYLE